MPRTPSVNMPKMNAIRYIAIATARTDPVSYTRYVTASPAATSCGTVSVGSAKRRLACVWKITTNAATHAATMAL